jgi:hypothetical protein
LGAVVAAYDVGVFGGFGGAAVHFGFVVNVLALCGREAGVLLGGGFVFVQVCHGDSPKALGCGGGMRRGLDWAMQSRRTSLLRGNSRFPAGMTERKAKAKARLAASLCCF